MIVLLAGGLPVIVAKVAQPLVSRAIILSTPQDELPAVETGTAVIPETNTLLPTPPPTLIPDASPTTNIQPEGTSILQTWDFGGQGLMVEFVSITKYGRHLVVAFTDGRLLVHNFETGQELVFRSPVEFNFLQFVEGISSNQAGVLVVDYLLNESGDITLWQISAEGESRSVANITGLDYFLTALAISPDGETLALGYNNGEIRLYRTTDGAQINAIPAHNDFVMSLEFSWDNRYLLSDSFSFDPYTHVFRVSDGAQLATLATKSYEPGRISFSPDSRYAAVTSFDGTRIFTTGNWSSLGILIPTFEGIFTCDSQGLIALTEGRVEVYSILTGEIIPNPDIAGTAPVNCLYDGRMVMISVDLQSNIVKLLSLEP